MMEPPPMDMGGMGYGSPKSSLMDRIIGVVTFKAPIYREIADDTEATGSAVMILVAVNVLVGLLSGPIQGAQISDQLGIDMAAGMIGLAIFGAIVQPIVALIGWAIGSWLIAFIATRFFEGKTDTSEMMRVFGFTSIFNLISFIPCVGLVALVLSIIGNVIGVREAAEFDTGKAVLTVLIAVAIVIAIYIGLLACLVFAAVALGLAAGGA